MIKTILALRNTYELVNNKTIRERTSSRRYSYEQLPSCTMIKQDL